MYISKVASVLYFNKTLSSFPIHFLQVPSLYTATAMLLSYLRLLCFYLGLEPVPYLLWICSESVLYLFCIFVFYTCSLYLYLNLYLCLYPNLCIRICLCICLCLFPGLLKHRQEQLKKLEATRQRLFADFSAALEVSEKPWEQCREIVVVSCCNRKP